MPAPVLARVELDRFWVNPGDRIFAMYTFLSSGPLDSRLDVDARLHPLGGGSDVDCSFTPCLPADEWPEGVFVREGLFPLIVPDDAEPGTYALLVALRDRSRGAIVPLANPDEGMTGDYCRACEVEVKPPRWVGRREPITHDLIEPNGTRRAAPATPIILSSDQAQVVLDPSDGLPYLLRNASGAEIAGEPWGLRVVASVHRLEPRASIAPPIRPVEVHADGSRAAFGFVVDWPQPGAISFSLVYTLVGQTLSIALEDTREQDGCELVQVELPGLASVSTEEPGAWIAYAEDGGQMAQLADTHGGRLRATTEWRFSAPVAMVGSGTALAVLEVPAYLDTTELTVAGESGRKTAWLGTTKMARIPGGPQTPNLPVEQASLCRLHILGDLDGNGEVNWLDGMKKLRPSMPAIPTRYYDERNTYKIFCQCGGGRPVTTFEQAGEVIRSFAALTDRFPQSVYLVGWQYTGHDTGYPAVDVVNEEIGGEEGLRRLMESAAEVGCTVSFHDNYDDAYRDSPDWEERYITRNPDGSPMMGGYWAGGQTWIIGMANYARERGWERAVRTCRRHGIRETYHIDVLSAEALRHDWNPEHPASAYANLMGKYRIIDAFGSCGADVTTEGVSWPFIGKVSWFNALQQARCERFGGEVQVPLVQGLYRHSARWGGSVGSGEGTLHSLRGGCCFGLEPTADAETLAKAVDAFYIIQVPWLLLRDRPLETWERQGDIETLGYGFGTRVRLDWEHTGYSISVDGVEIARDHGTFAPFGEGRLAFYSLEAAELCARLPNGWNPDQMTARVLRADGIPERIEFDCDGGTVSVRVPARTPVIVYRDPASITSR